MFVSYDVIASPTSRGTGGVGCYAIRTTANRPNLELSGAWVHSPQKDGHDVGTLAGIGPLGDSQNG